MGLYNVPILYRLLFSIFLQNCFQKHLKLFMLPVFHFKKDAGDPELRGHEVGSRGLPASMSCLCRWPRALGSMLLLAPADLEEPF